MSTTLIIKITTIILAATPISLIIINFFGGLFSKHNLKLGKTTTICTNLTNTLTKDTLIARTLFFDKYKIRFKEDSDIATIYKADIQKDKGIKVEIIHLKKDEILKLIAITASLCHFKKIKKIEEVILKLLLHCGLNKQKFLSEYEIIDHIPSHPEKKLSTIVAIHKENKEIFAFTKGNPLTTLKICSKTFQDGKKIELNSQIIRKLRKRIKTLNKNGEKVLAFAYKPLPRKRLDMYTESFTENDMTFLGFIGITNPIRKNLAENISLTKKAGIKTYILTKTKERKATATGKILKIINPNYFEAITGEYLSKLNDQKLSKLLSNRKKDFVFAELKEPDKKRIIDILRKNGETIAIADKNKKTGLNEIIKGIKKGRIINRNYLKYARHALSCKISEIVLIIFALLIKAPLPLTIGLILALDLSINLILEISLRAGPIEKDIMNKKYSIKNGKILSKKTFKPILIQSIFSGVILSSLYIWSLFRYGWTLNEQMTANENALIKSISITFVLLAITQIFNTYSINNQKKSLLKTKFLSNPYLLFTTIISILIIYIIIDLPLFSKYINISPLSAIEWQILIFLLIIIILFDELRKYLLKKF